jgi:Uma2 family endonuclease
MSTKHQGFVPLESGDRLTRAEFHRRYCARPDIKKAELVQGVVYVASPLRHGMHGKQHIAAGGWLFAYIAQTPGVQASDNATVFLDVDTEVQPDCCLFRVPPLGRARVTDEGYIEGVPDLVLEVAASSAAYDLFDKMEAYRRAGVPEYIVWEVFEGRIHWFSIQGGAYTRLAPDARGVIESRVFPGLRLAVEKMLAGDYRSVLAELGQPPDLPR